MRVISGKYKRRTFEVPRTFKARPTTDFAKENLFNVLTNLVDFDECDSVLDLFAGTGSISLEFVSRGCAKVISVEREPSHHAFIYKVKEQLGEQATNLLYKIIHNEPYEPINLIKTPPAEREAVKNIKSSNQGVV